MKIGVVGLGLIGGSIFKRLKQEGFEVVGVSKSQADKHQDVFGDYDSILDCSLVFVCTPMNKTLAVLDELEGVLPSETIVTDVCSLKSFVSEKVRKYRFVPSHPMAGTEKSGFENSFAEMFEGARWAITPIDDTNTTMLVDVICKMGAEPVFTTPDEHDEAVALISHMPMVLSQALFHAASKNPLAMKLAATGFQSMTRLAMEGEEMACDMVNMNYQNIFNSLSKVRLALEELNSENYLDLIKQIKEKRLNMFIR